MAGAESARSSRLNSLRRAHAAYLNVKTRFHLIRCFNIIACPFVGERGTRTQSEHSAEPRDFFELFGRAGVFVTVLSAAQARVTGHKRITAAVNSRVRPGPSWSWSIQ